MKTLLALLATAFILNGCGTSMNEAPTRAADEVGSSVNTTWNKFREITATDHKKAKPQEYTQARYCYKSFEDITCYRKPIPGQESRLTAWQGLHGETGYVVEPPEQDDNRSKAPISLPPLKSVEVAPPTPIKGSEKSLKEIIFDPAELMPKELVPQKTE